MKQIRLFGGTNDGLLADVPELVIQRGILRTYKRGTEVIEQYKINVSSAVVMEDTNNENT